MSARLVCLCSVTLFSIFVYHVCCTDDSSDMTLIDPPTVVISVCSLRTSLSNFGIAISAAPFVGRWRMVEDGRVDCASLQQARSWTLAE